MRFHEVPSSEPVSLVSLFQESWCYVDHTCFLIARRWSASKRAVGRRRAFRRGPEMVGQRWIMSIDECVEAISSDRTTEGRP